MSEEDTVMSGVDQTNDESLLTQLVNDNDENSTDTDDDTEPVSVVRYPELLCSSLVPRNYIFKIILIHILSANLVEQDFWLQLSNLQGRCVCVS